MLRAEKFDGWWRGILQRKSSRQQSPGYVDEAVNIVFIGGVPQSRPGIRPFNGQACSGPIRGMGWHVDSAGVQELLVAAGTDIQHALPGQDWTTAPLTNLPTADRTRTEPTKAHFLSLSGGAPATIIYDGVNPNLMWSEGQLIGLGFRRGLDLAAPTTVGGGNISAGQRSYVMTLVSPTHEGDPSLNPVLVTNGVNEKNTFTSPTTLAIDDPQVTQWALYGTVKGGADYFFIDQADIGVDITDNLTDAQKRGSTPLEELRNAKPRGPFKCMAEHRGQVVGVYASNPNVVNFSNFDQQYMVPEGWPGDWEREVAPGDGDEITALVSFWEYLVVFKRNGAWAFGGTWPDLQLAPILAAGGGHRIGIGVTGPGIIVQIENEVIFGSRDGVYKLERGNGVQAVRVSGAIDDLYAAARFSLGVSASFDRKRRMLMFWMHG